MLECIKVITKLAEVSRVTLIWVPGHSGVPENEWGGQTGGGRSRIGSLWPRAAHSSASRLPKDCRQVGSYVREFKLAWPGVKRQEPAKHLMEGYFSYMARTLLVFKKHQLRAMVGVLTGHLLNNIFT